MKVDITSKSAEEHKRTVKGKIRNAAHRYLQNLHAQHSKVRDIKYPKLVTQEYMTSSFSPMMISTFFMQLDQ